MYYLMAMTGIMTYGFYKFAGGIKEQNELAREKMWSRIHLIPLLQAEEDRDQIRRHFADAERQKALTGSEEGFKLGKGDYHQERFVRPTYAISPEKQLKD